MEVKIPSCTEKLSVKWDPWAPKTYKYGQAAQECQIPWYFIVEWQSDDAMV